ncbi:uncharacterized protein LOC135938146 [Cloeon dipterum]|uniref:uncharacterized protein LOC135938146 n=1 Tax=Cloeon dipterum TaxID=197152 RepID=UPI0032202052
MTSSSDDMRCCIPSCVNHHRRVAPPDATSDARPTFFGVPEARVGEDITSDTVLRRALWLRRLKKYAKHVDPDTALVCNRHFTQGHPAEPDDTNTVDWLPNAQLASPEELTEEMEEMNFEEEEGSEEENLDEEFVSYTNRQKEKVDRLKRENVALKRKLSDMTQTGIIQGMRLKMLKSMKVKDEPEDQEKVKVDVKSEPADEKSAGESKPKLQINNIKMKLSNILGTLK